MSEAINKTETVAPEAEFPAESEATSGVEQAEPVVGGIKEVDDDPIDDDDNDDKELEARDRVLMAAAVNSDEEEAKIVTSTGMTPLTAILEKCKDCSCGSRKERYLCTVKDCALWPFRKGYKPVKSNRKPMSEEAKAASRARFDAMLARRKAEREAKVEAPAAVKA